jgi:hypothetical protein
MWRWNPEFSLGYSNSWTIIEAQGNAYLHLQNPCTELHTCLGAAGKVSPSKTMQHIHVKDSFSKDSMHHSPSWTALGQHLQHTPHLPSLQVVALLFLLNTAARQTAAPAELHLACSTLSASSMGSSNPSFPHRAAWAWTAPAAPRWQHLLDTFFHATCSSSKLLGQQSTSGQQAPRTAKQHGLHHSPPGSSKGRACSIKPHPWGTTKKEKGLEKKKVD